MLSWISIRRWWRRFVVCGIAMAAVGTLFGIVQKPRYTAAGEYRVQVSDGGDDAGTEGTLGSEAKAEVADAILFSRAADSERVLGFLATGLHTSESALAADIHASPGEGYPTFRITATTDLPRRSVHLVNLTSSSLSAFVATEANPAPPAKALGEMAEASTDTQPPSAGQEAGTELEQLADRVEGRVIEQGPRVRIGQTVPTAVISDNHVARIELFGFAGAVVGLGLALLGTWWSIFSSRGGKIG